jgi:chromosome segregation ATPase
MRRRELSEIAKRSEEELKLSRAAAERHALAFERWMTAFDRHEQAFDRHERAFDRHEQVSDRHEEAFERHQEAFERHEEGFKRVMASLDRHEEEHGDLKIFIRDMNRRSEKVINDLLRGNREFCKELNAKTDSKTDEILAELREGREEAKAHREALLALIDRLPPPRAA